jgi:hypothetical protein
MLKVFISYSHADELFGRKLAASLSDAGAEVWIDLKDIPLGKKWSTAIQEGLDSCEVMLVIVSPDSMSSNNVEDEWQYYLDHQKQVIPILWRTTKMQFQLNRLQRVDFSKSDYASAVSELLSALGFQSSEAQQLQKQAYEILIREHEAWASFGTKESQLLNYDQINVILEHVHSSRTNKDIKHYLLCSVANLKQPQQIDIADKLLTSWIAEVPENDLVNALQEALNHSNSFIRLGIIRIIKAAQIKYASDLLIYLLKSEPEPNVQHLGLATLYSFDIPIPITLASDLLQSKHDWITKTYALNTHKTTQTALVITDGTEFAVGFQNLLNDVGYAIIEMDFDLSANLNWEIQNLELTKELFEIYDLILMVRGEHYGNTGNEDFYSILRDYVLTGGKLFATAWVGWETKQEGVLVDILPFQYQRFIEDVKLICHQTEEPLSRELFDDNIIYTASIERSVLRPNSTLLLKAQDGTPIFGYKNTGLGWCYYLNSCQHSCSQKQISPFIISKELKQSINRVLKWIYETS